VEFVNHTPFPAFAFFGVKPEGGEFHVIALRQTLIWDKTGQLLFSDDQAPLCETDEPFNPEQPGEIRQESDLCPYKPRCDIIVNGHAYPPAGKVLQDFNVRLRVQRPGAPVPLPPEPCGLNPFMTPSPEQMAAWRTAVERATYPPEDLLLDKTLRVTGERYFVHHLLGWELSEAQPINEPVPMRLSQAFGGQCGIEAGTHAAEEVSKRFRLTPRQTPDSPAPAMLDGLAANPIGCGFARQWYLDATQTEKLAAPRIESPLYPLDVSVFDHISAGRLEDATALVAGLGVRPRCHPDRVKFMSMINDAPFIDFTAWNAAWPDQQVDALVGNEIIELTNLCAPDTPGLMHDGNGNGVLRLKLPDHRPSILARFEHDTAEELETRLDTIVVDTEAQQVSLVWRATLPTLPKACVLEAHYPGSEHSP
jgi:hypothetical protein